MTEEFVILVDEQDRELGIMEKMEAHQKGLLHRALSVLIFNTQGEMLLQKRAESKYHSGGLWTNTCCSHPRPNESTLHAAVRRLQEEMGIAVALKPVGSFIYKATLDKKLTEYEFDHVYTGIFDGTPRINSQEVSDCKFLSVKELQDHVTDHPDQYTEWFKIILKKWDVKSILPQPAY